jgi:23S rRNA (cytidine1920-2'-O)/16S rRNA (cytidine1409-2'-O)-methyltransferase
VVRDDSLRAEALRGVAQGAAQLGLALRAHADCRVPGPRGNREIFALFSPAPRAETPAP